MSHAFTCLLALGLISAPVLVRAQQTEVVAEEVPSQALGCAMVTGEVTDENNKPLRGATVQVPELQDAFITNSEGRYLIKTKKPLPRNVRLTISAGGYEPQEMVVTNCEATVVALHVLPGTRFKRDGRIKKTAATGKVW